MEWIMSILKGFKLSDREIEVLLAMRDLALRGARATNREIGRSLGISEWTVSTHFYHIFPKFGVKTRYEAISKLVQI